MSAVGAPVRLHASAVVVGEAGILIRGPSGSGKSTLAWELVAEACTRQFFARLVGDDRVEVEHRNGRLLVRGLSATEGRIERRGFGLIAAEIEPRALVRLVVDCTLDDPPRLPEDQELFAAIECVNLPRLILRGRAGLAGFVLWRLRDLHDTGVTIP